jgi:superfamily II DNA or RNA helicase
MIKLSRQEKRKLERDLAKQPKEVRELVKVWKMENSPNGDIPVYAFMTYGWTFPLYWSQQGKIKSGVSNDPFDDGTTRMTQACSKKTPIAEPPRVIKELKQVWVIPAELVGLDRSKANKIRQKFDSRCNDALSKYKVKDGTSPLVGEEWYREISIEEIKELRTNIWEELLIELGTKAIEKVYTKMSPRGLQTPSIKAIIKEFKEGIVRFKGIAPTGFGKTVVAFLTIAKLKAQGLLKNRVVMMTAPNQFLANKNAGSFDKYAIGNKVKGIYNIPVFSGSDLGFAESHIEVLERNEKLASIIQGYLQDDPSAIIVLHTCNPSVQLVDDVLDSIGITEIDFAICDEAHTLASTYDSRWNYVLQDHKVKINSRFFLTATEKTLINPDFLEHVPNRGERVAKFNYMNNKEIFGDYCFKFSFAQGVDAGHIVPMITKVYEYSNRTSSVADMLQFIDSLEIPELEDVKDELGYSVLFDKKLARTIITQLSAFKKEGRNKSLTICSRNAHVDLLIKVYKALQDSGKYLQDVEIIGITARDYTPSRRQDLLDNIHDSDKKQIVVTGIWAITGVDCPSLDHIHWNFTPGSEISLTQGTGRGARLHKGKQNVLVTFNLDLDNPFHILRSKVSSTIGKLYDAMFPSHDVELKARMIRRFGRGFARQQKDVSGLIEESLRISIDQIFEAANGVDFKAFIDSFRNRSTDDEIEILAEELRTQYNPNLIYLKEELRQEILKSGDFKKLINIKLSTVVVDKVFEKVNSEYTILGRYSGYVNQTTDVIKSIIVKLANKHKVNFFGLDVVDINLIYENLEKELNKKIYNNKSKIFSTNLIKAKGLAKTCVEVDGILIPIFGGKRTEAKDIIRPTLFKGVKKQVKNIKDLYEWDDMINCASNYLDDPKFKFLLPFLSKRSTHHMWNAFLKEELGESGFLECSNAKSLKTKKERYGDDLSGIKKVVWTDEMKKEKSELFAKLNKTTIRNKANNVKYLCPDGHITSSANVDRYCKREGLKVKDCERIS